MKGVRNTVNYITGVTTTRLTKLVRLAFMSSVRLALAAFFQAVISIATVRWS